MLKDLGFLFFLVFFLSLKLQIFSQPLLNPENSSPRLGRGLVLKDLVWMTLWEFCLIKSAGVGFGKRIEHISLMAIIHSRSKFQALKIKISHLLTFIGVRKMSPLRS